MLSDLCSLSPYQTVVEQSNIRVTKFQDRRNRSGFLPCDYCVIVHTIWFLDLEDTQVQDKYIAIQSPETPVSQLVREVRSRSAACLSIALHQPIDGSGP